MERFDPAEPRPRDEIAAQSGTTLPRLVRLMQRLLADDGCPWDREQTLASLKRYVLDEACEVMDAIDEGSPAHLREELGDLLLQIVFQAELMRQSSDFAIDDVVEGIIAKLIRRHPHVFGAATAKTSSDEVRLSWEALKEQERGRMPLLTGVPRSLPGLRRAAEIGRKVHAVGFDWADAAGAFTKVREEIAELEFALRATNRANADSEKSAAVVADGSATADGHDAVEAELGDVLFSIVNLARHLGVDPERALQRTNDKFVRRFEHVERRVESVHGGFVPALPLTTLDRYWEEAKKDAP
jgi:MazG family protein